MIGAMGMMDASIGVLSTAIDSAMAGITFAEASGYTAATGITTFDTWLPLSTDPAREERTAIRERTVHRLFLRTEDDLSIVPSLRAFLGLGIRS